MSAIHALGDYKPEECVMIGDVSSQQVFKIVY